MLILFIKHAFVLNLFSPNFICYFFFDSLVFFFNICLIFYLAKLGLSFSMQDLRSLQHGGSLVVACEQFVVACGI